LLLVVALGVVHLVRRTMAVAELELVDVFLLL
jgi:hypothetical protein